MNDDDLESIKTLIDSLKFRVENDPDIHVDTDELMEIALQLRNLGDKFETLAARTAVLEVEVETPDEFQLDDDRRALFDEKFSVEYDSSGLEPLGVAIDDREITGSIRFGSTCSTCEERTVISTSGCPECDP
jgi:hypothetical protein